MSTLNVHGSGGRKRSSARVFFSPLKEGSGQFTVNKKPIVDYFPEIAAVDKVCAPLKLLSLGLDDFLKKYAIKATVTGGGKTGQRDALSLGLAKALVMLEAQEPAISQGQEDSQTATEDNSDLRWRRKLRKAGLLTRDSRKVEPKRYGLHKARKRAPLVKR